MISYLKSELYSLARRKGTYIFIILCSLLLLSTNVILAAVKYADINFQWATTKFSFSNLYTSMSMVFVLCITVTTIVFGNEHNSHTMKNSISYGISRGVLYFGKLITQFIYSAIAFSIIVGIYVISGYLLLEDSGIQELEILARTTLGSLPLLLFALAATNCFIFVLDSIASAIAATCGLILALPLATSMLGMKFEFFKNLSNILPYNVINYNEFDQIDQVIKFYWDKPSGMCETWFLGILQMLLITLIGFIIFRKKEIK